MQDEKRHLEGLDLVAQLRDPDVLDERPLEGERFAADHPLAAAFGEDLLQARVVVMLDMADVERRADDHHGPHAGDCRAAAMSRRTTPRMPDQDVGGHAAFGHERARRDDVVDLAAVNEPSPQSPPESPKPSASKRGIPMPSAASCLQMRDAAESPCRG